eukprot:3579019-Pyramimonas_sp.AAC.1
MPSAIVGSGRPFWGAAACPKPVEHTSIDTPCHPKPFNWPPEVFQLSLWNYSTGTPKFSNWHPEID